MTQQTLDNLDPYGVQRGKINANFSDLYTIKLEASSVLTKTGTTAFTPTQSTHPVPKGYADQLYADIISLYDPQAIGGDAFLLSNFTGLLDPDLVDVDATHRFHTDVQATDWDQKEDAIGSKGTAFNKNFGTGSGDVSEGDRVYTKTDVGLGDVDNVSGADAVVSDDTQDALDLKLDIGAVSYGDLTPQVSPPAHSQGRYYWDSVTDSFSVYNSTTTLTQAVGLDNFTRMFNNTGVQIDKGESGYISGADITNGVPEAGLAIATSFDSASLAGVAAHDIPDGTVGLFKMSGIVTGVDTSAWVGGTHLYLSSTTPGAWTDTPPELVTKVGEVILQHATTGSVQILPNSNVARPVSFGALQAKTGGLTVSSTTYANLVGYTNSKEAITDNDIATGYIQPLISSWFDVSVSLTVVVTSSPSSARILTFQVWNDTDSVEIMSAVMPVAVNATDISRHFKLPAELTSGKNYAVRLKKASGDADIVITSFGILSFDIQSISA